MRREQTVRSIQAVRFLRCRLHGEYQGGIGDAVYCGGLHKRRTHRWHGFAAILAGMAVRGARHGIAALHRLFRCGCGTTVDCIGGKSNHQQC